MILKLFAAGLVLAGLGLALRLYMGRTAEDTLGPGERIDIRELRDPIPGNAFLACPPGYCRATAAPSPILALPVERLSRLWDAMITEEPPIAIVPDAQEETRLAELQNPPLM